MANRQSSGATRSRRPAWQRLVAQISRKRAPEKDVELLTGPIRGDLLGAEQLAERARVLARSQRSVVRRRLKPPRLLARLNQTRRVLETAHRRLLGAVDAEVDVGPAGEWFLDNYHVVQDHIVEVTESLPRSFYRELPELTRGALSGYPRVYELAISLISHSEARVDLDNVESFVSAFQEVAPLSIGELWALPAMLRLGLLESVRRMALRTVQRLDEVQLADKWVQRIQAANEEGPQVLNGTLRDFVAERPSLTPIFVSRFLNRLRHSSGSFPPLVWLESWLAEEGLSAEDATARSTQRLALTQLMMANSITSLRAIAQLDWRTIVESQSRMEHVLREDPAAAYAVQTFATRDRYRHVVERIAKRRQLSEAEVAQIAIDFANDAVERDATDRRRAHVGYYLVDDGLRQLEEATDYRPSFTEALFRAVRRHPNFVFFVGVLAGTAIALAAVLWLGGAAAWSALPLVLALAFIPANDIAVNVLNQLITALLPPRVLPKLDLSQNGIPDEARTVVVVPTLFGSVGAVTDALEHLEVQYLANRDARLHFAVLSDFTDADTETREGDDEILAAAVDGIRGLNARYHAESEPHFHLFHRQREWNPVQGKWMGWERKRGKLAAFNRFLRRPDTYAFTTVEGEIGRMREARYVITLDSDTILPPNAAAELIGTISHPLNSAGYDEELGRVTHGYGIIQPRVGVSLTSAYRSRFAEIYSGHPGVDPYTTAVSDVYQDLFGEGSYTGKGIYDVDAFEQATRRRFPENTLLSHDLIEGNYARAGLATDITLYDEYPTRYLTYTRRKHRWIRGDWQLLSWLTPRVPGPSGREPNRLSPLSRWKIFDNLRRSVVEIAQLLFLVAGWTILPGSPIRWTLLALGAIAAPWLVSIAIAAVRVPLDKSWPAYYSAVTQDAITSIKQFTHAVAFLPHQAFVSVDAIVRTLVRMFITRRNLLEWTTASQAEQGTAGTGRDVWRTMWPVVPISIGIVVASALTSALTWPLAIAMLPLVALWAGSPLLASVLSRSLVHEQPEMIPAQRRTMLRYALLHWTFFDRNVSQETNWLAPDNVQDDPTRVVAMRTSPTNIGLQLLSVVSAHDLGFISSVRMIERLEHALASVERMQKFRGHLYNWYELSDLRLLEPAYISTVDSGNLAGHLIALRQACLSIAGQPPDVNRLADAVDTALVLAKSEYRAYLEAAANGGNGAGGATVDTIDASFDAAHAAVLALYDGRDATASAMHAILELRSELPQLAHGARAWIDWAGARITEHEQAVADSTADVLHGRLTSIAERAYELALAMDFRFLFDEHRELFSIGYQTAAHARDASFYDLLASEARLASFIAIAKDDVPVDHWFRLGRSLTNTAGETAMISWSGSMFEYLMPALIMQSFPSTLIDQTYHATVRRQIGYGEERDVPWGVSESAYNLRDRHQTYQYRAFGIPDLALKRGLGRDLVIAPYASMLAAMVDLHSALDNLAVMERKGALGSFGFRDAIDYTRPDPGKRFAIVQNYMAHHIGMSLVALTNVILARVWQRRFHADPIVQSAELLLHERVPRRLVLREPQEVNPAESMPDPEMERSAVREIDTPDTPQPQLALLGSMPYTVMVTQCGSGFSRYSDIAVTRWRADGTRDNMGQFCYVRDIDTNRTWSASHQPTCAPADWYRAFLATDRVTFHRADGRIETRTEIAVVADDAAEVRRVTVTNNDTRPREIELTSYGEIVLGSRDADRAHPAFANLFVETEWHEWCTALIASRRPRSSTEATRYCVHVVDTCKEQVGAVSYETDRARFIGRSRTTRDPAALDKDGTLDGRTGAVLDPIFSLRTRIRLDPGQSASVAFTTLIATTREQAFELADRYHGPHAAQRALDLAWTATQIELRELDVTPADAAVFQEIAGYLLFSNNSLRAPTETIRRNTGSQPRLWANGVSGDWPILLATIDSPEGLPTLRQLFAAHGYLRRRGLTIDLVVLNTFTHSYIQELNERITQAMFTSSDGAIVDQPGGVFLRRREMMNAEDLLMLEATARVHVRCDGQSLTRILDAVKELETSLLEERDLDSPTFRSSGRSTPPSMSVVQRLRERDDVSRKIAVKAPTMQDRTGKLSVTQDRDRGSTSRRNARPASALRFANGYGGLDRDDNYEITVATGQRPPAPWINVIANVHGGFVVSESGAGAMWAENSYFYRVTPWHNDPVSDPVSDVLYLRDEESRDFWSATPLPIASDVPYTVRHAAGTSSFAHERDGIASLLTVGIAPDAAVKVSTLRLTNNGPDARRISTTAFVEWTLGMQREQTQYQVRTRFDGASNTIFARNHFDELFAGWIAFLSISEGTVGHTADRKEFIGRNGSLSAPAAMRRNRLGGMTGVGLDPCAALQCVVDLAPGETREIVVALGAAPNEERARALVEQYADTSRGAEAQRATVDEWNTRLSVLRVHTPDDAFNAMVNQWTLYQAMACRMWGRTALYQSSGAYGFRDQLQDVMAFVYAEPAIARSQIVRASARQFLEGDVQHWWHPQTGRGVRTRFSDDLVWLPHVVNHYVRITGDAAVLDEYTPFLEMRELEAHEHEVYDLPKITDEHGSVYEHCLRALRRASTIGERGLPLIGSGDWNDGMSRVGIEGRGESVWLAWFLVTTLREFAVHCDSRGDTEVANDFRARADAYVTAIESNAWDGAWYRRAYFDDGTPLGTADAAECRIDSIAQSWSVISGAGRPDRQQQAMQSLEQHLVRNDARLIMLLTPPFDVMTNDPGYIKGYVPGVRENGAQYTHAALWAVMATAMRGNGDRAFELYQMLNPLTHTSTREGADRYKVEPYAIAADVYTAEGQLGRGGWTWYTGSASWSYRVALESLLGFTKRGNVLRLSPCIPRSWPAFSITYRFGKTTYAITVRNPHAASKGVALTKVDGAVVTDGAIPLVDDGGQHEVIVVMGNRATDGAVLQ